MQTLDIDTYSRDFQEITLASFRLLFYIFDSEYILMRYFNKCVLEAHKLYIYQDIALRIWTVRFT